MAPLSIYYELRAINLSWEGVTFSVKLLASMLMNRIKICFHCVFVHNGVNSTLI